MDFSLVDYGIIGITLGASWTAIGVMWRHVVAREKELRAEIHAERKLRTELEATYRKEFQTLLVDQLKVVDRLSYRITGKDGGES